MRIFGGHLTLLLTLAPAGTAQQLLISEYVEGSGDNRAVEIFNAGTSAVDLSQFRIDIYRNGNAFVPAQSIVLGGTTLLSPSVYVLAHPLAQLPLVPDQTSGLLRFNGDDAVALVGPSGNVDVIGQIGFDPGSAWTGGGISTKNQTLRRTLVLCANPSVGIGRFDPSLQWQGFPKDDFTDLGLPPAGLVPIGCGPGPVNYCTAGTSASGCRAVIWAVGIPSATSASGFVLAAGNVEGKKEAIFFFGVSGRQAAPWGNGSSFQCVVPPVKRAELMPGVGMGGACDGLFSKDMNSYWCPTCPKPAQNPGAGALVQAQLWYRDPFSTHNQTTSFSDAVEFHLNP